MKIIKFLLISKGQIDKSLNFIELYVIGLKVTYTLIARKVLTKDDDHNTIKQMLN